MSKPFVDLICEMRNDDPVCHSPGGGGCAMATLYRRGSMRAPRCEHWSHWLCQLAVKRMAQVFEAARAEEANGSRAGMDGVVSDALRAANANVEGEQR